MIIPSRQHPPTRKPTRKSRPGYSASSDGKVNTPIKSPRLGSFLGKGDPQDRGGSTEKPHSLAFLAVSSLGSAGTAQHPATGLGAALQPQPHLLTAIAARRRVHPRGPGRQRQWDPSGRTRQVHTRQRVASSRNPPLRGLRQQNKQKAEWLLVWTTSRFPWKSCPAAPLAGPTRPCTTAISRMLGRGQR